MIRQSPPVQLIPSLFRLPCLGLLLSMLLVGGVFAGIPKSVDGQELPSLAPMLERVTPAVVNISTRSMSRRDRSLDDFYRFFYGTEPPPSATSEPQSLGSGVIVDASRGLVVTNNHVIENASEVIVNLRDGRELVAEMVGTDPKADIALLRIPAESLSEVQWADSDALRVGDFCVAIGNPFGLGQTVTSGIVSALRRSGLGIEDFEDFIQTDASINPGNSGGALVNLRGELIGINTAIVGPSGGNVGIGFAIPSNMAQDIIAQLLEFGEVRRGKLGISAYAITKALAKEYGLSRERGVLITDIEPDSPAQQAGLKPGDIITAIEGQRVKTVENVINRLGLVRVGQRIDLAVVRNNKEFNVQATVARLSAGNALLDGVNFENATTGSGRRYVVIKNLDPASAMARKGLQRGDIVLSINRTSVETVDQLTRLGSQAAGDEGLLLLIQRGQETSYIELP